MAVTDHNSVSVTSLKAGFLCFFCTSLLLISLTLPRVVHAFICCNLSLSLFVSPQMMNRCQRSEGQRRTSFLQ